MSSMAISATKKHRHKPCKTDKNGSGVMINDARM